MSRVARAAAVLVGATVAVVVATALPASAHVTVSAPDAQAGGYTTLTFKVPTERDDASTTKVDVAFPLDTPIASVSVQPKAGWTYEIREGAPSKPLTAHGAQVTEVVSEIIWTADGPGGIKPGEFDTFVVSAGPLPENVASISFKTLQTYSNGEVVRWIETSEPGQPEPENPAPTLALSPAADETGAKAQATAAATSAVTAAGSSDADGTARGLGVAGLVVGVLGLATGALALVASRRRAPSGG
ncbi:YcnI family protein [Frankia sp. CNm7]|uniref:YcnI family protein n=2 Tax=Frankia nepalensis TaxID=1836974 RepID=A0A937RD81_9ACTN|nr:YcnI family protein [Frankia nepalensis]MBL7495364.1 YcnI family protein [Frankia nepalensis]MBL7514478.1 YcnI family protein [Frankia nepalensis]MBL7518574.1 YcnI family protein [Frankia nepalensis]MBL7627747.1 YcnI family protein [Frankia nepalensis]